MNHHHIQVTDGPTPRNVDASTVVGAITASVLADKGRIPYFDPLDRTGKTGYQRKLQESRVKKLADALKQRAVDLPTAILLSIRKPASKVLIKENGKRILDLSQVDHLYVVDGQHRMAAIKEAMKGEGSLPPTFKVPFVCMLGTTEEYEMEQFHTVNSTSRPVPTDLALELLQRRYADKRGIAREGAIREKADWKISAMEIIKHLFDHSKIWKDRIRLANMPKEQTTVPSTSFVSSLQSVLKNNSYFRIATTEKQAQLLNAYWGGIREVFPEAFALGQPKGQNGYEKYTLQRGVSVRVLHGVFNSAMEIVRSRGGSPFDSHAYASVLKNPILEIEGENGHNEMVSGKVFWLAGKEGCIANYSHVVGIQVLTKRLEEQLPQLNYGDELQNEKDGD